MESADFTAYAQPEWNDTDSVAGALRALERAADETASMEACDRFLWALGNNHSGTFYPVVLAVLPNVEHILKTGTAWSQHAVLEALIDLGGSFIPEEGHETHQGIDVKAALRSFVHSLRAPVAALAHGSLAAAHSAQQLLELIDDQSI